MNTTETVGTVEDAMGSHYEPKASLHLTTIIYVEDLFTVEECETIINYHSEWENIRGEISSSVDTESGAVENTQSDYRICTVYRPRNLKQIDWINNRLLEVLPGINQEYYQFDIQEVAEEPQFVKYEAEKKGHYDYHLDIGPIKPNCWRKLSYCLFLNDDYEGGELEFKIGERVLYSGPVGKLIIFPSYLLYRVKLVTSGTFWAMHGWTHGSSFS